MRAVLLSVVVMLSATAAAATSYPTPRQAHVFHRNPHDCLDAKAEPLFMADWWYDLSAAGMERRITPAQHDDIVARMMKALNTDLARGEQTPPADVVKFCEKMNVLRPHWSQW